MKIRNWTIVAVLLALVMGTSLVAQNPFTLYFGTAPADTNSGNKSAATLRVVLATDQPSMTNGQPVTNAGTFAVQSAQSGTWTVQPGNTANTTAWRVDGSAVTQPVSLASVPSHAVTNAGTFATQSAITAASGSIASGAIASGAVASGAYASGAFAAQSFSVGAVPPAAGTLASGAITSAMTGTTSTSLIGATASNYIYVTSCTFSNTHASVTTMILLQDGSGGTTLWEGVIPFGGGSNITFPVPLKVPTAGNALFTANVTTGSNTFASCNGFKSTVSY